MQSSTSQRQICSVLAFYWVLPGSWFDGRFYVSPGVSRSLEPPWPFEQRRRILLALNSNMARSALLALAALALIVGASAAGRDLLKGGFCSWVRLSVGQRAVGGGGWGEERAEAAGKAGAQAYVWRSAGSRPIFDPQRPARAHTTISARRLQCTSSMEEAAMALPSPAPSIPHACTVLCAGGLAGAPYACSTRIAACSADTST